MGRSLFWVCDYTPVHQHEYSSSQLSISCLTVISLEIKHFVVCDKSVEKLSLSH